jgi:hypothetical protein
VANFSRLLGIAALMVIALFAMPAVAFACPVCGLAGTQDNWAAYGSMSVMLSILPLGMIGGIGYWVIRKYR